MNQPFERAVEWTIKDSLKDSLLPLPCGEIMKLHWLTACLEHAGEISTEKVNCHSDSRIRTNCYLYTCVYRITILLVYVLLCGPRGGRYGKNIISWFFFLEISRFYHDSLSCWFLLFCKLSEQCSQTNFPIIKPFKVTKKGEKRTADIYNSTNLLHLYSAFLGTQSALHRRGGISSTTPSVQHPPGWCNGSHVVPERPTHTSILVERRQSDEPNQCMGIIRPWCSEANFGQSGQR